MKELDSLPQLKWVPINELYVDPTYQRSTGSKASQRNLKYLVENFTWKCCGALIVAFVKAKKKYAVLDGQHRLEAARQRGDIENLPCLVVDIADVTAQTKNFVVINTKRVQMNSLASYHAAVAAGDPDAVDIDQLLRECKIEVPKFPVLKGDTGPRQIQAVGALQKLITLYSKKNLMTVLKAIPEAYGEERGQLRSSLLKAACAFKNIHPELTYQELVDLLGTIDPDKLEEDARTYSRINGGTTTDAMVIVMERHLKSMKRKGAV